MRFNFDILLIVILIIGFLRGSMVGARRALKRAISVVLSIVIVYMVSLFAKDLMSTLSNILLFLGKFFHLFFEVEAEKISYFIVVLALYLVSRVITYLILSIFIHDYSKKNTSELVSKKSAWGGVIVSLIPTFALGMFLFITFSLLGEDVSIVSAFIYGLLPLGPLGM